MIPENKQPNRPLRFLTAGILMLVLVGFFVVMGSDFHFRWHSISRSYRSLTLDSIHNVIDAIRESAFQEWPPSPAHGPTIKKWMWDLNHDGLIDGLPAITGSPTADGGFTPEL